MNLGMGSEYLALYLLRLRFFILSGYFLISSTISLTTCLLSPRSNMTVYSVSNRSLEDIDPHKQPQQNPPVYSPLPETATLHQDGQEEHRPKGPPPVQEHIIQKPTIGERFHKLSSKAGWPINKAANVVGSEGWWPSSMEKECNKAARILHSFTSKFDPTLRKLVC